MPLATAKPQLATAGPQLACRMSARHPSSQLSPRPPTTRSSEAGPQAAAMAGSSCIATAEPRYMPEVVSETQRARSVGGIHWDSTAGQDRGKGDLHWRAGWDGGSRALPGRLGRGERCRRDPLGGSIATHNWEGGAFQDKQGQRCRVGSEGDALQVTASRGRVEAVGTERRRAARRAAGRGRRRVLSRAEPAYGARIPMAHACLPAKGARRSLPVCTEGIRKPWATPTNTRAEMMALLLLAEPGVRREAMDQQRKEADSIRSPP